MNIKRVIIIVPIFIVGLTVGYYFGSAFGFENLVTISKDNNTTVSPYVGQETRQIKSLSPDDIEALQQGSGVVFGGMAKPAELNGFPGPKHTLELASQLNLTLEQKIDVESLFTEMQVSAIELGNKIIIIEQEINDQFTVKTITENALQELLNNSASLYGQLRNIHLKAHLATVEILSQDQVTLYNQLRGYNSDDPCLSVPEGHDPTAWKLHNNCG